MKKRLFRLISLVMAFCLLPVAAPARAITLHGDATWQTLNAETNFVQPYTDYTSVFDRTKEKYLFDELEKDIFELAEKYPEYMRLETIGYSELGRPLYAVVVGSDAAPNRFMIIAGAHAREYTTVQLLMLQLEFYLHNYNNSIQGEKLSDLFDRCQYYFLPQTNPDGAELSMRGLASLDDARLTASAEERAAIKEFALTQVYQMNEQCEKDVNYHDSDAPFYTQNPDPYGEDAFMYWKSNVKGVDLHYSMYTPEMFEIWKSSGSWYTSSQESHFSAPHWENFTGVTAQDGINNSKENTAICDYVQKIQPNFFASYHTASGIVQWDYGYGRMQDPTAKRAIAQQISQKSQELLNFRRSDVQNPYIGHPGWFLLNSQKYMDGVGYGVTLELCSRQYLNGVDGRASNYMDAPPTQIVQLTQDVKADDGTQRYSLWTTTKYWPVAIAQYIMDNKLIGEVTPLSEKSSFTDVPQSFWARGQIERAFRDGAINGTTYDYATGKRTFSPENTLTLAHFTAITTRAFYPAEVAASTASGAWYAQNEDVARKHGLFDGLTDTNMDKAASRYQMAAIAANVMKDKGATMPSADELKATQSRIADWSKIPASYRDAVATVFSLGIINGYADGTFSGDVGMKRSYAAAIYARLADALRDPSTAKAGAAAPVSAVKTILGQSAKTATNSTVTLGVSKTPAVVENYGTYTLPKASQTTLTASDIGPVGVTLYDSSYGSARESVYVSANTPVYFTYESGGKTVYGTFTAQRLMPVTSIGGTKVRAADLPTEDRCTAAAPSLIVAENGIGLIEPAESMPSLAIANIGVKSGCAVKLYTDSAYTNSVTSIPLVVGNNDVYLTVTGPNGDVAYYMATVKNIARSDDATIKAREIGGIQRGWYMTPHAGTKEDPDELEVRVNAAYFGTTNSRSFSNICEKNHPDAKVAYYSDPAFSNKVTNYNFSGKFEGGFKKEIWFGVTSADGTVTRYTHVTIRPWQELLQIGGMDVTYLGLQDGTAQHNSKNMMVVEVAIRSAAMADTVHLKRDNGEMMGNYPNVKFKMWDDGQGERPETRQMKSITKSGVPEGYDAFFQIGVVHEDTSKAYYQVNVRIIK
ncbi:MAG: S-layer homology domain-containing protein [Oscillibacter sp.]|nr:S-layer homology domain-containing protein [Oscillibacter sp.]